MQHVSVRSILENNAVILRLEHDANQRNDVWMTKLYVYCYLALQLVRCPAFRATTSYSANLQD